MQSSLSTTDSFAPLSLRGDAAKKAFTLIEIIVALAILGLLVGLAVSKVGNIFSGAQVTTTRYFVQDSMKTALTTYRIQVGDYPSTAEGLQALLVAPADKVDRWHGPYVESLPNDPWGHPYKYLYPGNHNKDGYDLWSVGPDGVDGTADDIGNW
jgi:general secretion pathway protein G